MGNELIMAQDERGNPILLARDLPPLTEMPPHSVLGAIRALVAAGAGNISAEESRAMNYETWELDGRPAEQTVELLERRVELNVWVALARLYVEVHFRGAYVPTEGAVRDAMYSLNNIHFPGLCGNCGEDGRWRFECPEAECRAWTAAREAEYLERMLAE